MSSRLTRQTATPSRVLSLLTAAILMAGTAPLLAATEQPTRNMGDYAFAIGQQPLVSALNAFTAVTGWQVGLPACRPSWGRTSRRRACAVRYRRRRPSSACWWGPT